MTIAQITEYVKGWTDSTDKSDSTEIRNPTIEELELFNISAGIDRQRVPKK